MLNNAALFLALRYLRPKRSFVSVITIVSIIGVLVGVLMMVVVRSVMQGFEVEFRQTLMGAEPHVLVSKDPKAAGSGGKGWMEILAEAKAQPGITSATPFAGGVLYVSNGDAETAMQTLGVSREDAPNYVKKLARNLVSGSLDLAEGTLVMSDAQAQEIGVGVGDEISVYAGQNVNSMVRKFRAASDEDDKEKKKLAYQQIKLHPRKLKVSGIIRAEKGGYYGYTSLRTGQDVFALGPEVTGIAVELDDPNQARAFADALKGKATGWNFQLWTDAGEARLAAMGNEQTMMQLVLSIIALVAAFSVMNTTITVTTQKRREIGVLTALGCRPGQVMLVFLYQAIFVGVLGTGLGLAGGLLVLHYRNGLRQALAFVTGGQVHAVEGVFLSSIPAHVEPMAVAITCAISLVLCVLAGLIPAWFASRVDSAVALRD